MGRKKAKETIEITEGLYLKKNGTSDKWHYYFRLERLVFRSSTKTLNKYKALQVAVDAHQAALLKKLNGTLNQRISFRSLSEKYLETLKGQSKEAFHRDVLKRHFLKFFGKIDDISKINEGMLNEYLIYRREKSDNKVLNQSLNKENVVFNQMMRMAQEYEWISKSIQFKRQSEAQSQNRRPHFTRAEYAKLLITSRKRLREYRDQSMKAKSRALLTVKLWQRSLLHDVIVLLANTGMRVDELKSVTWRDIDWQNSTISLRKAGKTKSFRVVLVRRAGMQALGKIKRRRLEYLKSDLDENEQIQSLANGVFVSSMKKSFNELLKECGFSYQSVKNKHTLTSLRHTFATSRLTALRGNRASMRGLSKQMGTSQRMLEKHYGHDVIEDYKEELLG